MTGLIWMVQVVHYPLMGAVGEEVFVHYESRHTSLISLVVLPIMLLEIGTGGLLIIADSELERSWLIVALLLLVLVWLSTFLIQVPLHSTLTQNFDPIAHKNLVQTNWIRTILWTIRSFILLYLMGTAMKL